MEESVIFEIQVERKTLEHIFNENQHLKDSYDMLIKNDNKLKCLKQEITKLQQEINLQQNINKQLSVENNELKTTINHLENKQAINYQEHGIQSQLLKMKLEKIETEHAKTVAEYAKEKNILKDLARDRYKLVQIQDQLQDSIQKLDATIDELKKTKETLVKTETENKQLDEDKLNLEQQIRNLTKKIRLFEEKIKCSELGQVESKLLKLKLQSLEKEKQKLINDAERERKIMNTNYAPTTFEEHFKKLRKWIERQQNRTSDDHNVDILKEKIQQLENEKLNMIEGFQLERKVFQNILKTNQACKLP